MRKIHEAHTREMRRAYQVFAPRVQKTLTASIDGGETHIVAAHTRHKAHSESACQGARYKANTDREESHTAEAHMRDRKLTCLNFIS